MTRLISTYFSPWISITNRFEINHLCEFGPYVSIIMGCQIVFGAYMCSSLINPKWSEEWRKIQTLRANELYPNTQFKTLNMHTKNTTMKVQCSCKFNGNTFLYNQITIIWYFKKNYSEKGNKKWNTNAFHNTWITDLALLIIPTRYKHGKFLCQ